MLKINFEGATKLGMIVNRTSTFSPLHRMLENCRFITMFAQLKPPFDRSSEKSETRASERDEEEKISFCLQKIVENSSFSDDIRFNENCFSLEIPFVLKFSARHWSAIDRHEQHIRLIPVFLSDADINFDCEKAFYCIIFPRFIFGILTILLMFLPNAGESAAW